MVLLRGFDERGFGFFTNYDSQKGRELAENPRAALVVYWGKLGRQVRVNGDVVKQSVEESTAYFHGRPLASQISALASPQSQVIPIAATTNAAGCENQIDTPAASDKISVPSARPRPPRSRW